MALNKLIIPEYRTSELDSTYTEEMTHWYDTGMRVVADLFAQFIYESPHPSNHG
jgi:hypothetical protein